MARASDARCAPDGSVPNEVAQLLVGRRRSGSSRLFYIIIIIPKPSFAQAVGYNASGTGVYIVPIAGALPRPRQTFPPGSMDGQRPGCERGRPKYRDRWPRGPSAVPRHRLSKIAVFSARNYWHGALAMFTGHRCPWTHVLSATACDYLIHWILLPLVCWMSVRKAN